MESKIVLENFREVLREFINSPSIGRLKNVILVCRPCDKFYAPKTDTLGPCPKCPLSDKEGPKELIGKASTCLTYVIMDKFDRVRYRNYTRNDNTVENILAESVLLCIKLSAYLEQKGEA